MLTRTRWSLAVPLVALAALFGMHGLGDHTGAHATAVTHGHPVTAVEQPLPGLPAVSPVDDAGAGAAVVCFAVLVGGAIALLVLGRTGRRTSWTLPRGAWSSVPVPRSRAPDPSTPTTLSVCRC